MASGFGAKGSEGRCYPLWQGFSKCMSTAEDPSECKDVREDYLECLHHKKEFQRANAIQAEADRQRGEEATKIWAKIEKHVNDTSWGEVKKEGEGEKAS